MRHSFVLNAVEVFFRESVLDVGKWFRLLLSFLAIPVHNRRASLSNVDGVMEKYDWHFFVTYKRTFFILMYKRFLQRVNLLPLLFNPRDKTKGVVGVFLFLWFPMYEGLARF